MLTIFDESSPWSMIDYERYCTYLDLRKIRDDFLKSLTTVRHYDYLIDKKLVEAGGLGKRVYIYPARGSGRDVSCKRILELIESGRDVKVMNFNDTRKRFNADEFSARLARKRRYEEHLRQRRMGFWEKPYIYPHEVIDTAKGDSNAKL